MNQSDIPLYHELCDKILMPNYPFFINKLHQMQKVCAIIPAKSISQARVLNDCDDCASNLYYKLGNIVWPDNIEHRMKNHQLYPSEYFINVIINTSISGGIIVNPPIQINPSKIPLFNYIPLHYNKLLIMDALMQQGSNPRYLITNNGKERYIYSEHSGVISLNNNVIDNIIVSTETDRIDPLDGDIYLPFNVENFAKYEFLFHTHPNTLKYGGRIGDKIIYEFPSANDIYNFVKFHNEGKAQASVVISPEGTYVIRPISYQGKYHIEKEMYYFLRKFIIKIEKLAIKHLQPILSEISDPDTFHQTVGSNLKYIRMYNRFIEPYNLFIEYYPREKKNGEWRLTQINLQHIDKSK